MTETWRRTLTGWLEGVSHLRPSALVYGYVAALIALGLFPLIGPIVAYDHDLWFHLSHGRYLFAQGEIPSTSYFSFLEPPRTGIDYYWLFQALVYGVHSLSGYLGLIALRTVLYGTFLLLVARYLLRR